MTDPLDVCVDEFHTDVAAAHRAPVLERVRDRVLGYATQATSQLGQRTTPTLRQRTHHTDVAAAHTERTERRHWNASEIATSVTQRKPPHDSLSAVWQHSDKWPNSGRANYGPIHTDVVAPTDPHRRCAPARTRRLMPSERRASLVTMSFMPSVGAKVRLLDGRLATVSKVTPLGDDDRVRLDNGDDVRITAEDIREIITEPNDD